MVTAAPRGGRVKARPAAPGCVRIVGGRLRGSKLPVAASTGLRPTPARVRETLFNWLQPVVAGARVLDLFAGSGALGLEALSRGAATLTLVERDPALARSLAAQLQRLQLESATLQQADALAWLRHPAPQPPFDLVLLDPPFADALWEPVAARLEQGGWLTAHAWIYVETPRQTSPRLPSAWQPYRESLAGQVRHALYRRQPVSAPVDK